MALSRNQRNEVLLYIEARGLSRGDFSWRDGTSGERMGVGPVERELLVHNATGTRFTFESQPGEFGAPATTIVIAGGDQPGVPRINEIRGWPKQIEGFGGRLDHLLSELEVPDLWADLGHNDRAVFVAVADPTVENTPFTKLERDELARVLTELTAEVKGSFALTSDSIRLLDAGVAQLIDDSQHMGRKDWLIMFIGVMVTVAVTAAIPHLLPILLGAFGHVRTIFTPGPLGLPPA